jgi:hypothetical protein
MYNGGLPIYDYEVHVAKRQELRKGTRIQGYALESLALISTASYMRDIPVAYDGFTVSELAAATDYVDVKVRAINAKGASVWSEDVAFTTKSATPPTKPLHLKDADRTDCRSFELVFEVPLYSGGVPIKSYEARFKEEIVDYATMLETGNKVAYKLLDRVYRFAYAARPFTVKGLRYSTKYTDIEVVAVNSAGLSSFSSNKIEQIVTAQGSLGDQLDYDIRTTQSTTASMVDTMHMGFHQRFQKDQYVMMLVRELEEWQTKHPGVLAGKEEQLPVIMEEQGVAIAHDTSLSVKGSNNPAQKLLSLNGMLLVAGACLSRPLAGLVELVQEAARGFRLEADEFHHCAQEGLTLRLLRMRLRGAARCAA